jgi:hypothetical protein
MASPNSCGSSSLSDRLDQRRDEDGVKKISLFVSSPGDVLPEHDGVSRVVQRINDGRHGLSSTKDIRWEDAYCDDAR